MLSVGAIAILFPHSCIDYVDIDCNWRWFVIITITGQLFAEFFNLQLPAVDFDLLEALREFAIGQAKTLHYRFEHPLAADSGYLNAIFAWQGMDGLVAEETAVLPGMEELASLMQITALAESGQYDVVVVDCAPTGATLQLLAFPELARWYLDKIIPFQKAAVKVAGPMLKRMIEVPLPDEDLFHSIEDLVLQLHRVSALLGNPAVSSMRLVLNPEKMVVKEAQRALTYLSLYGYATDLVVCNRMIPPTVSDSYFANWKDIQAKYHQFVEESFSPLPILDVPWFDDEVVGTAMLRRMGEALYGTQEPTAVYFTGHSQEVRKINGAYQLRLPLPFVEKSDIRLTRSTNDELIVRIGNWKRNIALPRMLAGLPVQSARYEESDLVVSFKAEEATRPG